MIEILHECGIVKAVIEMFIKKKKPKVIIKTEIEALVESLFLGDDVIYD